MIAWSSRLTIGSKALKPSLVSVPRCLFSKEATKDSDGSSRNDNKRNKHLSEKKFADGSSSSTEQDIKTLKKKECFVFGFPKNANRLDLQMILGDHKPIAIEPYVSKKDWTFAGCYRLRFENAEDVDRLRQLLQKKFDKKYFLGDLSYLADSALPASSLRLSHQTVIVNGIASHMGADTLYGWFAGYNLAPVEFDLGDKKITCPSIYVNFHRNLDGWKSLLIQCADIGEARRLAGDSKVFARLAKLGKDKSVQITHFHA